MNNIKIRIDYNVDPNLDSKAKQVVYLENTLDELNIRNLIGKTISNAEYEPFHNCLVLTLVEDMPEFGIAQSISMNPEYTAPSAASIEAEFVPNTYGSYNTDKE